MGCPWQETELRRAPSFYRHFRRLEPFCVREYFGEHKKARVARRLGRWAWVGGGNVSVPDERADHREKSVHLRFNYRNNTTNYIMNDNNNIPTKVAASGTLTRHLQPFDVFEVVTSLAARQSPEPCRISSGTRITGEPPFVYSTSTDPLLPTAHCLQDKILEIASKLLQ